MIYYKLRRKEDPTQFVYGTPSYQSYDTKGRVFQSIGSLRAFITNVMSSDEYYNKHSNGRMNRVADWEVVELEMVVKDVKGVHEIISAKKLKELLMK